MQPNEPTDLTPADRELEAALKSLAPSRTTDIDPVAAAFAAGSRSARRQVRFWRSAAAAVLVIGIGSWLIPFDRAPHPPPTLATVPPPPVVIAAAPPAPPGSHSLVALQHVVHEKGVDGLPTTEAPTVRNFRLTDLF